MSQKHKKTDLYLNDLLNKTKFNTMGYLTIYLLLLLCNYFFYYTQRVKPVNPLIILSYIFHHQR